MDPIAAGVGFLHFAIGKTFHLSRWWKRHLRTDDKCLDFEKNLVCRVLPCKGPRKEILCNLSSEVGPCPVGLPFSCFHSASPAGEAWLERIFSCFLTSEGSALTEELKRRFTEFVLGKKFLTLKDRLLIYMHCRLRPAVEKDGFLLF